MMSSTRYINNNSVSKKCGEIIITMKKNAKNVYSFNCWFCDTIYIQMKKFTLHLEQEHVKQLENSTDLSKLPESGDICNDQLCRNEPTNDPDSIFVTEIKIEEPSVEDIKEIYEENQITESFNEKKDCSLSFSDPLKTMGNKTEENVQLTHTKNEKIDELKTENINLMPEQTCNDIEMYIFSEEEQADGSPSDISADENTSDSDFKEENSFGRNITKGIGLDRRVNDKDFILALIDAYYKTPQLWNTSNIERCNFKQKEDLLQAITDDLSSKFQLKLKVNSVKKKLNFICKQYENEIEKQLNRVGNVVESRLWFYQNMNFLKPIFENKLKLKRKKPNHKVKPLNDNLMSDLIDIYKNYHSLWDVNHLAYTVKDKRQETMQSMLEEIEKKMNLVLDIYKLEKNLHYIHKAFAKDKNIRLECEAKKLEFQPACSFYKKCEFLENNQGPFKCTDCCKIIETYNEYQIHRSQHDGSIPFKCQECGMGFKKISNYTIHAKRHLRVFKFYCNICGKGYPFNAELDLHMRSHTGAQPYLCSICGEGFRTAISYDNHIRRHEERFKYFCHICKKGFNHKTRLNDHVKAHLNVRDIICSVCGKGFTSRKYLNHHKRIHEGKNYSCNICGKSFAQDAGLRAHKKYHGTPIGVSTIKK